MKCCNCEYFSFRIIGKDMLLCTTYAGYCLNDNVKSNFRGVGKLIFGCSQNMCDERIRTQPAPRWCPLKEKKKC